MSGRAGAPLAARMKHYEHTYRTWLPKRAYVLLRVDGRAFHSYTRTLDRPFDAGFVADMNATALSLCRDISGSLLAYVQSDEISVLTTDLGSLASQHWMGAVTAKVVSLSAARATATFNRRRPALGPDDEDALFDSRVWAISDPVEVANYFIWRQRDAVKNSITMAASAHFDHTRLEGLNSNQRQELLWSEARVNWNDYPDGCKRGRVVVRRSVTNETTYIDPRTQEERTATNERALWVVEDAPHFTHEPDALLRQTIPTLGWEAAA